MGGPMPKRVARSPEGSDLRREYRDKVAKKKRAARDLAKARKLGFTFVPSWLANRHPPGCQCYDCLWGKPTEFIPTVAKAETSSGKYRPARRRVKP